MSENIKADNGANNTNNTNKQASKITQNGTNNKNAKNNLLSALPSVDSVLSCADLNGNREFIKRLCGEVLAEIRAQILQNGSVNFALDSMHGGFLGAESSKNIESKSNAKNTTPKSQNTHNLAQNLNIDSMDCELKNIESMLVNDIKSAKNALLKIATNQIKIRYERTLRGSFVPLINASGVIIHTNLGRSPISLDILQEIAPLLCSYNNLEYDLNSGTRGDRHAHFAELFCSFFGVESALVVNNNAAAVFLVLNTFAKGRGVVVSRGELVEIGGSFRIPSVMEQSGAILREVGTTNRTHLSDYEKAINAENSDIAMIFKAHKSNFEIAGFSAEVPYENLVKLSKRYEILDYYDLGSGYFAGFDSYKDLDSIESNTNEFDFLEKNKIYNNFEKALKSANEPSLQEIIKLKPSLVSFSGDKLFGSAQAGIIFGKKELIDKLKKNQILRMLRPDKFTLITLEASLRRLVRGDFSAICSLDFMRRSVNDCKALAERLCGLLQKSAAVFCPKVIKTESFSGGGAMPNRAVASFGVLLDPKICNKAEILCAALRDGGVVARILKDFVLLDMRAIFLREIDELARIVADIAKAAECGLFENNFNENLGIKNSKK